MSYRKYIYIYIILKAAIYDSVDLFQGKYVEIWLTLLRTDFTKLGHLPAAKGVQQKCRTVVA